jgi:hypothetical protein
MQDINAGLGLINSTATAYNNVKSADKYAEYASNLIPPHLKLPVIAATAGVVTLGVTGYLLHKEFETAKHDCNLKSEQVIELQNIVEKTLGKHACQFFPNLPANSDDKKQIRYPILYNEINEGQYDQKGKKYMHEVQAMVYQYLGGRAQLHNFLHKKRGDIHCGIIEGTANFIATFLPHWHYMAKLNLMTLDTKQNRYRNQYKVKSPSAKLEQFMLAIRNSDKLGDHENKLYILELITEKLNKNLFPFWQNEINHQSFSERLKNNALILEDTWTDSLQVLSFLSHNMEGIRTFEKHPNIFATDIEALEEGILQTNIHNVREEIPLKGEWRHIIMKMAQICQNNTLDQSLPSRPKNIQEAFLSLHKIFRFSCERINKRSGSKALYKLEEIKDPKAQAQRVQDFYDLCSLSIETTQLQKILNNLATLSNFGGEQAVQTTLRKVLVMIKEKAAHTIAAWEEKLMLIEQLELVVDKSYLDKAAGYHNFSWALDEYVKAKNCDNASSVGQQLKSYFKKVRNNVLSFKDFIEDDIIWSKQKLDENEQRAHEETERLVKNLICLSDLQIARNAENKKSSRSTYQKMNQARTEIRSVIDSTTLPFLLNSPQLVAEDDDILQERHQLISNEIENITLFEKASKHLEHLKIDSLDERQVFFDIFNHINSNYLAQTGMQILLSTSSRFYLSMSDFSQVSCNEINERLKHLNDFIKHPGFLANSRKVKTELLPTEKKLLLFIETLQEPVKKLSKSPSNFFVSASRNKNIFIYHLNMLERFINRSLLQQSSNKDLPEKIVSFINRYIPKLAEVKNKGHAKIALNFTLSTNKHSLQTFSNNLYKLYKKNKFFALFKDDAMLAQLLFKNLIFSIDGFEKSIERTKQDSEIKRLKKELRNEKQLNHKTQLQLTKLKEENERIIDELNKLKQEYERVKDSHLKLNESHKQISSSILALKQENSSLKVEVKELKEKIKTAQEVTDSSLKNLEKACVSAAKTFEKILSSAKAFRNEANQLKQQNEPMDGQIQPQEPNAFDKDEFRGKIERLNEIQTKLSNNQELLKRYEQFVNDIASQAASTKEELLQALTIHKENASTIREIRNKVENQFIQIDAAIKNSNEIILALRNNCEEYKQIILVLQSQVNVQLDQITKLQQQMEEKNKLIDELQNNHRTINDSNRLSSASQSLIQNSPTIRTPTVATENSHNIQRFLNAHEHSAIETKKHDREKCNSEKRIKFILTVGGYLIAAIGTIGLIIPDSFYINNFKTTLSHAQVLKQEMTYIIASMIVGVLILQWAIKKLPCIHCLICGKESNKLDSIIPITTDDRDGDGATAHC